MFTDVETKALSGFYKLSYKNAVALNDLEAASYFASIAQGLDSGKRLPPEQLKEVLSVVSYVHAASEKLFDTIGSDMVAEKLRAATVKNMYAEMKRKLEDVTKSAE